MRRLIFMLLFLGCGTSADDCASREGVCRIGGFTGACVTPHETLDCNPERNPGGAFCCVPCDGGACG